MFNSFAIWLDPAQQNGHGAQYESNSVGIWHKCCEGIQFESVKARVQVLATWTQAHTFLLELAQESDCGTSLLLDPGVKLWKNILEKKVRIYITQYERNRIGKSMVLLPEVRGWPAGFNTGRSKVPGETLTRSYAFLQISSAASKPSPPSKPICSHLMSILFCLSQEGCWHIFIWFLTPSLSPGF